jgi:hypothetical protein
MLLINKSVFEKSSFLYANLQILIVTANIHATFSAFFIYRWGKHSTFAKHFSRKAQQKNIAPYLQKSPNLFAEKHFLLTLRRFNNKNQRKQEI